MKQIEAAKRLISIDRDEEVCVFTKMDLKTIFREDNGHALDATLKGLLRANILTRAVNGVYVYALTDHRADLIEHIARAMRRGEYNYVSLESALSEYGVISQVPMCLTVMTTGRRGRYQTPFGAVEFTHTERQWVDIIHDAVEVGRPLKLAKKHVAWRDLKRVGRNIYEIDEDLLFDGEALEENDDHTHNTRPGGP